MRASQAVTRLAEYPDVNCVLDIGSGAGEQAAALRDAGKAIVTNSLIPPADLVGDYFSYDFSEDPFDAIFAAHVLEHQPNVNLFLRKCFNDLRDGGVLAVTVPPPKHAVVGGHLTLWNSGILLYNLVVAGFDCSAARVSDCYPSAEGELPYNISVIVRKKKAALPPLAYDEGDIERLAKFFPFEARQGFDGRLEPIDW